MSGLVLNFRRDFFASAEQASVPPWVSAVSVIDPPLAAEHHR